MKVLPKTIGLFDSGSGGLSILNTLLNLYPFTYTFFADTAHLPYGEKTAAFLLERGRVMAQFFLSKNISTIIVACHTFSATALTQLQQEFPSLTFIDMLPPTLIAAQKVTVNKRIGIMATQGTINTHIHKKMLLQLDPSLEVFEQACPLLVPLIEDATKKNELFAAVAMYVKNLVDQHIDTLILGCTHYAFVEPIIRDLAPTIILISAHSLTSRLFTVNTTERSLLNQGTFIVSGSIESFALNVRRLMIHTEQLSFSSHS